MPTTASPPNAGATLDINGTQRLNTTGGNVLLNGGTLIETNPGQAGSFIGGAAGLKGLEINGSGTIGYNDGDNIPDNKIDSDVDLELVPPVARYHD